MYPHSHTTFLFFPLKTNKQHCFLHNKTKTKTKPKPSFLPFPFPSMAKKRKSIATTLDEVDRTMYASFCTAANSLSQLHMHALNHQKLSFQAGQRHSLVNLLINSFGFFYQLMLHEFLRFRPFLDKHSRLGLNRAYLSLSTYVSFARLSRTIYRNSLGPFHKFYSTYFHKFSNIAYENNLCKLIYKHLCHKLQISFLSK